MTVYQKLAATETVTTDGAFDFGPADLTEGFGGQNTMAFLKVTNPDTAVSCNLSFTTAGALVADDNPVIIAPNTTEFIQVASTNNTGTVYGYISASSSIDVYVTPVSIVGA